MKKKDELSQTHQGIETVNKIKKKWRHISLFANVVACANNAAEDFKSIFLAGGNK